MYRNHQKILLVLGWLLLAITGLSYAFSGAPFPRPLYLFVGVAISTTVHAIRVLTAKSLSRYDVFLIGTAGVLSGLLLRISGYIRVVSSGVDHGRWLARVDATLAAQAIVGDDMYAASPLYILELAINKAISGIGIFETRFVTIIISALLPFCIGTVAWKVTHNDRIGLLALLLTVPQTFFLRTSTLLESESLAIVWFVISFHLLSSSIEKSDKRHYLLLAIFTMSAVILHFLYGVLITTIFASIILLLQIAVRLSIFETPISTPQSRRVIGVIQVSFVFVIFWILWSTYAHTGVSVLASIFTLTLPNSVFELFIPTTGTVAASSGSKGTISVVSLLGKFLPLLILFGLAFLGGANMMIYRKKKLTILLAGGLTTIIMTVSVLIAGLEYNLGFRLYYFVSIFAILFSSYSILKMSMRTDHSVKNISIAILIMLFLSYAIVSPLSPLGNNIDPRFGGDSWAITQSENEQLQEIDQLSAGVTPMKNDVEQLHPFFAPTGLKEQYLTQDSCKNQSEIADTGDFIVCQQNFGNMSD